MRPRLQPPWHPKLARVRIYQISGISLMTLSVLNSLFLETVGALANLALFLCGVLQLWLSFRIWNQFNRNNRQRRLKSYV